MNRHGQNLSHAAPELTSLSSVSACFALIRRDLILTCRSPWNTVNPMFFLFMVASLFPLGISPDRAVLSELAVGIIWIGVLLAVMLSMDAIFKSDHEDGALEQLLMSPHPLPLLVLAKVFSHWLTSGFLLTLVSPLLAIMLYFPVEALPVLMATLLLGTPVLSLSGAIGSALTVRIHRGSVLLTLLSIPLYIPVLIFSTEAVHSAVHNMPYKGHILWLSAFLMFGISLAPWVIASSLRVINE